MNLIVFSFTVGNFCTWANFFGLVYFVLDLGPINFFMAFKRRTMLELEFLLQIANVVSGYWYVKKLM